MINSAQVHRSGLSAERIIPMVIATTANKTTKNTRPREQDKQTFYCPFATTNRYSLVSNELPYGSKNASLGSGVFRLRFKGGKETLEKRNTTRGGITRNKNT